MANGTLIQEIQAALEQKELSTKAATRLTLALQLQLYNDFSEFKKTTDGTIDDHDKRIHVLEDISVVRFIQRHPKITVSIVVAFLFISTYVDIRELILFVTSIVKPG